MQIRAHVLNQPNNRGSRGCKRQPTIQRTLAEHALPAMLPLWDAQRWRLSMSGVFGELDIWLEIIDEKGNRIRMLGQMSCLDTSIAAYEAAERKYSGERVILKRRAMVMRDSQPDHR